MPRVGTGTLAVARGAPVDRAALSARWTGGGSP